MRLTRALLLAATIVAAACGSPEPSPPPQPEPEPVEIHTDDLSGIVERGVLRVLVEGGDDRPLPRRGDPVLRERALARAFAERWDLDVRFVPKDTFAALLPALEAGLGDIVAANLTVTPEREERHSFAVRLGQTHEVLVRRKQEAPFDAPEEITGRIGFRAGTSFETTARELARTNAGIELVAYAGAVEPDAVLDSLETGTIDYAIEDANRLEAFLDYRDDIEPAGVLTTEQPLAWAVRKDNPGLLEALNEFLHEEYLLRDAASVGVADLPELKKRGRIRMITRNNAATYFLWRGEVMGFEYELAHKFAEDLGLRLEVVVAPSHEAMIPMLMDGEGDFVAAFLTETRERIDSGIGFSRPYHYASEVVVGRAGEAPLESVEGLAGRRIAVRPSSSYRSTLDRIRAEHAVDFEIVDAPETMETEAILAAVAGGEYDLTVADSHLLDLEMTARDDLAGLLQIGEPVPHGWAVHPDNEELLAAIDDFIRRHYRGLFYNVTWQKYFERPERLQVDPGDLEHTARLSPYDELVQELVAGTNWDWRLLVAQMYQESRFDPHARSWAGARGLMQVLPRTARELGISNLEDPRSGIRAGILYLDWVWDRFPESLDTGEHIWFTLAAYNAGHGHVRDARRLARKLGLDPDVWFDNVEVAMLRLSQAEYAKQARHGYVRGREPVEYVREIRERYRAYASLLEASGR